MAMPVPNTASNRNIRSTNIHEVFWKYFWKPSVLNIGSYGLLGVVTVPVAVAFTGLHVVQQHVHAARTARAEQIVHRAQHAAACVPATHYVERHIELRHEDLELAHEP